MFGNEKALDEYLRSRLRAAANELHDLEPDLVLAENADVVVASLLQSHLPSAVSVDWGEISQGEPVEVTTTVRDDFLPDRTYEVQASRIVLTAPILGSPQLLDYRASHFTLAPRAGEVRGGKWMLEITERRLDAEGIARGFAVAREDIDRRANYANQDLRQFTMEAEVTLLAQLAARKERILNDRSVAAALPFPVNPRPGRPATTPVSRRHIELKIRAQQAHYVPEPVLDQAIFEDILAQVRSWARSLERTPRTLGKLDEEELRDLILGALNTYWQGQAGGELFNGGGKTDILVRANDRNVFIAECKIWQGAAGIAAAVDQLLRYLVWRDSKAALIVFIKRRDPAAIIAKLHEAIAAHPKVVLAKPMAEPEIRGDYVVAADDEGRRVQLAVLPVLVRPDREAIRE